MLFDVSKDDRRSPAVFVSFRSSRRPWCKSAVRYVDDGEFDLEEVLLLIEGARVSARASVRKSRRRRKKTTMRSSQNVQLQPLHSLSGQDQVWSRPARA